MDCHGRKRARAERGHCPRAVRLHRRLRRFPIDHRGFTPVLLRGYATTDLADEKRFTLRGNFRVSGTEKIGERTLLVLELRKQG